MIDHLMKYEITLQTKHIINEGFDTTNLLVFKTMVLFELFFLEFIRTPLVTFFSKPQFCMSYKTIAL
jgi:hypothetical protein